MKTQEKKQYAPGKHPNSIKNLKPCKKGETHNPKGRPTNRLCLTSIAREKLGQPCPHVKGKTWAEYLVDQWLEKAVNNTVYFCELIERLEGKVTQPIGGEDGKPIEVSIDYKDKLLNAISRHADRSGEGEDTKETQP